jgi:hypothetical protein
VRILSKSYGESLYDYSIAQLGVMRFDNDAGGSSVVGTVSGVTHIERCDAL